jgi:gamma-glutamyltranspeptidase/glutathione hydrolase
VTLADLKTIQPVAIDYKGYKTTACAAPSDVATLAALKFSRVTTPGTLNVTTHFLDKSMKFAYGERTNLGDPSFLANMTAYEANMLSERRPKK